jgi:hypothetical protein
VSARCAHARRAGEGRSGPLRLCHERLDQGCRERRVSFTSDWGRQVTRHKKTPQELYDRATARCSGGSAGRATAAALEAAAGGGSRECSGEGCGARRASRAQGCAQCTSCARERGQQGQRSVLQRHAPAARECRNHGATVLSAAGPARGLQRAPPLAPRRLRPPRPRRPRPRRPQLPPPQRRQSPGCGVPRCRRRPPLPPRRLRHAPPRARAPAAAASQASNLLRQTARRTAARAWLPAVEAALAAAHARQHPLQSWTGSRRCAPARSKAGEKLGFAQRRASRPWTPR